MLRSRIAERVGRRVATFKPDLVHAVILRLHEKIRVPTNAALRSHIELHHPASDARGVELFIPCGIKRISEIHALAVTAHLDHLGTTA